MIDDQSLILVDNCWLVGSTYSDSKPRQGREAILQFGSLWPPMFAFWCSTAIISNRCWHALECCGSWRNIAGRSMAGTFDKLSFVDCIFFTFAKCILRLQRQTRPDSILYLLRYSIEFLLWIWVLRLRRALRDRFLMPLGDSTGFTVWRWRPPGTWPVRCPFHQCHSNHFPSLFRRR